jgi:4-hydroxyphenylacetate 3-monooxygenase
LRARQLCGGASGLYDAAVGSEFASRHDLYEMNYAGSYEQTKVEPMIISKATGCSER